jgi:branched-chain amino acid aminotransferase
MSSLYTMVNGALVPAGEASLFVNDLSIQRGYGIFDFFKIVNRKPIFLEDHIDRFFNSASYMALDKNLNREALTIQINELMNKNQLVESGIRITLTGGYADDSYTFQDPNIILAQFPLQLSREIQPGIKLLTHEHQRQFPSIKTIDYLMAMWLQPMMRKNEVSDILYHSAGRVTECPRANFFIVTEDGILKTDADNVLKGITRKHLLQLASGHVKTEETEITLEDVRNAKEAFITSTTKHVLPVIEIDRKPVGAGVIGKTTKLLAELLNQKVFFSN